VRLTLGGDVDKLKSLVDSIGDLDFAIFHEEDEASIKRLTKLRNKCYYFLVSKKFIKLGIKSFYLNYFYD